MSATLSCFPTDAFPVFSPDSGKLRARVHQSRPTSEEVIPASADEAIVQQVVHGGEPDAFRYLIERYRGRILGTASRFTRNQAELEDLSQEIFLKIWKGLPGFRQTAPFEHWLMRVTVRVCYDFLRKHRRSREHEVSREALLEGGGERAETDGQENAELARDEAREVLHHAMDGLKPKDRLVLILREVDGRSVHEVADLTGWTESNVKVRAMRARQRLKARLIELGYAAD